MIIFGKQVFLHLLNKYPEQILSVMLTKDIDKKIFSQIVKCGIKIQKIDNKKAQALARGGNHQGFLAVVKDYEFIPFSILKNSNSLVFLCGISDIGNIGSIIRSCVALGCDGLIISNKQKLSEQAISSIIRISSAAAYEFGICFVCDELGALNELKQSGFSIIGSCANAKDVKTLTTQSKFVLLMGSEDKGINKKTLGKCDEIVAIKMKNNWDSLNVGVATALLFDRIKNG